MSKKLMYLFIGFGGTSLLFWGLSINFDMSEPENQASKGMRLFDKSFQVDSFIPSTDEADTIKEGAFPDHAEMENEAGKLAIADIESHIENIDAIERLNSGDLGPEEQAMLGEQLQHLDRLRVRDLEQQLLDIENEVARLEVSQAARLKAYGIAQQ